MTAPSIDVGLIAVAVAVTDEVPRVLVVRRPRADAGGALGPTETESLPFGGFDPAQHRTLELGLRRRVAEQSGLELRWVEQLYTFGDRDRDPSEARGGPRVLAVAYLALTQQAPVSGTGEARWRDWYGFLPWEDWRSGRPPVIDEVVRPELGGWIDSADDAEERRRREERTDICFGSAAAPWDPVRTLERYELLYEAGLVAESTRDRAARAGACATSGTCPVASSASERLGSAMALDDRRILATALGRLRGKIAYRPVVFELLPSEFTLLQLQRVVEALAGARLHKQNFRRMLTHGQIVEPTGRVETFGRGRPAELYRFRRAVLRAKPSAGVALPTLRASP